MGNITTAMVLDHEAMDSHTVTVTAASNASDETDSIDGDDKRSGTRTRIARSWTTTA